MATGGLKPDLTLIFDLTAEESRRRATQRAHAGKRRDRLDAEDLDFHTRVREAYLRIAAAEPARVRIVDASPSIEETHAAVLKLVIPFLEEPRPEVKD